MNGKILDIGLWVVLAAIWLAVATTHPGVANLLIAYFGLTALGYYNSFVRHRHADDELRPAWR
ncbi:MULTISPECIES: hypothetical protein [unclassified Nocardia]|uniref:hypothetical protein n=1 Tax=unclassified Nocardia TaxID=2637762 RepID=UPI001CE43730|nr:MULTISPECIES: hypothetical protein [unclassified Nocardia]